MPGQWEWVIIFAIFLLLFGAKRLPDIAKSIGKGIQEFKKALKDGGGDDSKETDTNKDEKTK